VLRRERLERPRTGLERRGQRWGTSFCNSTLLRDDDEGDDGDDDDGVVD
jgi:hypothetical protein